MKTRQLWWQCSHSHTRTIPGRVCNTENVLGALMVNVEREHAKLYPLCPADLLRIAPKRAQLNNDKVALQWQIDHPRVHQSYAERKDARVVVAS